MSEQITTAAERQALPPGTVVLSSGGTIACRHVDLDGVLFGMDVSFPWDRLQLPLTVLYRPDQPQRVQPSREEIAEAITGPWFNSRTYSLEVVAMNVEAMFGSQPTVAEVRALFAEELADEEDRATAEEVARSEVAGVRCARCDLRYEEREQYACHEHGPHAYREDELREAGEVRIIPTYAGDELRARARAERGETES